MNANTRCLLCHGPADHNPLRIAMGITTSTGSAIDVDVRVCLECAHIVNLPLARLLELARQRHERLERRGGRDVAAT